MAKEFTLAETHYVKGIGTVIVVYLGKEMKREEVKKLLGQEIMFNNKPYEIIGVESFLRPFIYVRDTIGLLISKENII